jgi:hypothetical protein
MVQTSFLLLAILIPAVSMLILLTILGWIQK